MERSLRVVAVDCLVRGILLQTTESIRWLRGENLWTSCVHLVGNDISISVRSDLGCQPYESEFVFILRKINLIYSHIYNLLTSTITSLMSVLANLLRFHNDFSQNYFISYSFCLFYVHQIRWISVCNSFHSMLYDWMAFRRY